MKLLSCSLLISLLFLKSAAPQGGAFWQRPGIDVFPHISYFDQYVNSRYLPETWGGTFTSDDVRKQVKENYRMLKEAGFTHTVSFADEFSTDPSINPGLKIFDRHLEWSAFDPMEGSDLPGKYIFSQAQDPELYPFRVAGELPTDLGMESNNGFGNRKTRSIWVNNPLPDLTPGWVTLPLVGKDQQYGNEWIRTASPEDGAGYLFYSKINRTLFTSSDPLTFYIDASAGEIKLPDTTLVLTILIRSSTMKEVESTEGKKRSIPIISRDFNIRFKDIKGKSLKWIRLSSEQLDFSKAKIFENQIEVAAFYHGTGQVSVKSFWFADKGFLDLTENKSVFDRVKKAITTKLEKYKDNPLFESFYTDEPYLLTTAVRKLYTEIIRTVKPVTPGRSLDIATVSGAVWLWNLMFDRKNSLLDEADKKFFRNFLLFDYYPLRWFIKNGWHDQRRLQQAFDELIEYPYERITPRDGKEDPFQYIGYLQTIQAAQNLTPDDLTDDVPIFQTVQVSGSKQIKRSGGKLSYNPHPLDHRVPTRHEIFAMGNLAIAYGATGLMYYMVPSRIDPLPPGDLVYNFGTYGIFDDPGNIYDENDTNVCMHRAGAEQVPNQRYYAVQEFITDLNKYSTNLLRLHWVNGYSANLGKYRVSDRDTWIERVTSSSFEGETDETPFVEVGLFRQLNSGRNAIEPDSLWLFVVNKLCDVNGQNSSEGNRKIKIELKKNFEAGFKEYDVLDLTTGVPNLLTEYTSGNHGFELPLNSGRAALILLRKKLIK